MGHAIQKQGPVSTWSPTYAGFSSAPSGNHEYTLYGQWCLAIVQPTANGTSNAATFTLTLPFAAHADMANLSIPVTIRDNSTNAVGRIVFRSGSNVLDIHPSATSTTWTSSNEKSTRFSVWYRIA